MAKKFTATLVIGKVHYLGVKRFEKDVPQDVTPKEASILAKETYDILNTYDGKIIPSPKFNVVESEDLVKPLKVADSE